MKNFSNKFKYIIFLFTLIIAGFVFSNSAHATTYDYSCPDGGVLHATVTLNPAPPFNPGSPATFDTQVSMFNQCSGRNAYFTAQHNGGTIYTVVPSQFINAGASTSLYNQTFSTPAVGGSFSLDFVTWADDPVTYYFLMGASSFLVDKHQACLNNGHIRPYGHGTNTPFLVSNDVLYQSFNSAGPPPTFGARVNGQVQTGWDNSNSGPPQFVPINTVPVYGPGWIGLVFDYYSPSTGFVAQIDANGNVVQYQSIPNDVNGQQDCSSIF